MSYAYKKQLDLPVEEARESVTKALAAEGFGILSEIPVHTAFKEKLAIDYPTYYILGACNPQFAHQALEYEKDLGLLLPCNVIVYDDDGTTTIAAVLPTKALSVAENEALEPIAREVEERVKRAIDATGK